MVDVTSWSETPSSNTTVDGVSIAPNCSPGNIDNGLRSIMAGIKTYTLTVSSTYAKLSSATLTTPAINGATINAASTVSDTGTIATNSVGFRGMPQLTKSASYTLALTDNGKHISTTTGGIVIPANASVAFPIGAAVGIYNNSGSTQTISITSDTLRLGGVGTTGSRTLAAYGFASLVKVAATEWVALGNVT